MLMVKEPPLVESRLQEEPGEVRTEAQASIQAIANTRHEPATVTEGVSRVTHGGRDSVSEVAIPVRLSCIEGDRRHVAGGDPAGLETVLNRAVGEPARMLDARQPLFLNGRDQRPVVQQRRRSIVTIPTDPQDPGHRLFLRAVGPDPEAALPRSEPE